MLCRYQYCLTITTPLPLTLLKCAMNIIRWLELAEAPKRLNSFLILYATITYEYMNKRHFSLSSSPMIPPKVTVNRALRMLEPSTITIICIYLEAWLQQRLITAITMVARTTYPWVLQPELQEQQFPRYFRQE